MYNPQLYFIFTQIYFTEFAYFQFVFFVLNLKIRRSPSPTLSPELPPNKKIRMSTSDSTHAVIDDVSENGISSADAVSSIGNQRNIGQPPSGLFQTKSNSYARPQIIRLVLQCLQDLGFEGSVKQLEKESGIPAEIEAIGRLRGACLDGRWTEVEKIMEELFMLAGDNQGELEDSLMLSSSGKINSDTKRMSLKLLIKKQKFLELLEAKQLNEALLVLRNEISCLIGGKIELMPYKGSKRKISGDEFVQELTSFMMYSDFELVKQKSDWPGTQTGREILLDQLLLEYTPSSLIIPPKRWSELLDQAIRHQQSQCLYPGEKAIPVSLFQDMKDQKKDFPSLTHHVISEHSDEVWFCRFSHEGNLLATASKDGTSMVFDVADWKTKYILSSHSDAVSFVSWSPDDSMLLTCGNDKLVNLWDMNTGECIYTYDKHLDAVTSCAWMPDNKSFVSSSLDKTIYLWGINGQLLHRWLGARVTDLAISHDGRQMIAVCHEKKIRIYDLIRKSERYIQEKDSVTSLCLSQDSKYALVNVSSSEIRLWDIDNGTVVAHFVGQKQGRFVIRSCFGGVNDSYVLSGSEDSNVYVWNREQTKLIEILSGHRGTVNSVSWNPTNPKMFASASDDYTVRIWGPPKSPVE